MSKMGEISEKMKLEMRLVARNGICPVKIRPEAMSHPISLKQKIDDFIHKTTHTRD